MRYHSSSKSLHSTHHRMSLSSLWIFFLSFFPLKLHVWPLLGFGDRKWKMILEVQEWNCSSIADAFQLFLKEVEFDISKYFILYCQWSFVLCLWENGNFQLECYLASSAYKTKITKWHGKQDRASVKYMQLYKVCSSYMSHYIHLSIPTTFSSLFSSCLCEFRE